MNLKLALTAVTAGMLALGAGCVHYDYTGLAKSQTACHDREMEYPAPTRQKVYLFMMNGADLLDATGLSTLRDKVCAAGYPKVYIAQRADITWYEYEIRRIAREDPHARFILLGLGSGAEKILPLAAGVKADGVTLDAVILLDPACAPEMFTKCRVARTIVIRSHHWKGNLDLTGTETLIVENIGHLLLPNSPPSVNTIVRMMLESTAKVGPLESDPLPSLPLSNKPNPTPRGAPPQIIGPLDEWDFLKGPPPLGVPATPPEPPAPYTPPRTTTPAVEEPSGERLPTPRTQP